MKFNHTLQSIIGLLFLINPAFAMGDENFSSKLNNKSKQNGNDGYYLVKDTEWGNNCVIDSGKDRINPGDVNTLIIKKGCQWGGVRYNVFTVTGNSNIGSLGHSFHNGKFSIEISAPCDGTDCNFVNINPLQNK